MFGRQVRLLTRCRRRRRDANRRWSGIGGNGGVDGQSGYAEGNEHVTCCPDSPQKRIGLKEGVQNTSCIRKRQCADSSLQGTRGQEQGEGRLDHEPGYYPEHELRDRDAGYGTGCCRSKQQGERAQVRYLLPRLGGGGPARCRHVGGVDTRGPGETKLEMDRRRIRTRLFDTFRFGSAIFFLLDHVRPWLARPRGRSLQGRSRR